MTKAVDWESEIAVLIWWLLMAFVFVGAVGGVLYLIKCLLVR